LDRTKEMEQRFAGCWMKLAMLLAMAIMLPGLVRAQGLEGQGGQDRAAFAGGQMVRGVVTAVTSDQLTVKTESGEVYQVAVSANTRVTKQRQPMKVADIRVGDGVGAMGVMDVPTKTIHAVFVGVIDAAQLEKEKEDLGKTYITGKVTAVDIDALKITVLRPDGVTQVIAVDEGTSFRRGGRRMAAMINGSGPAEAIGGQVGGPGAGEESVTLADVKVGDRVVGPGTVKNGVFVPTELGVMDVSAMRDRRRQRANGAESGGAAPAGSAGGSGSAATPQ
jgi:hypothetical protein